MQRAFQVATTPIYQGKKPTRNPLYRRFVKRFACIGCGTSRDIDPMHTGEHALGQKADDMDVLPGCRKYHDAFDADPRGFALAHGLDIDAEIQKFNGLWAERIRRSA